MNKIYKVVWNAARNCYVVGSEFISKTRRGGGYCHSVRRGGTKALAAAMTVLALTAGYGTLPVQASTPEEYTQAMEAAGVIPGELGDGKGVNEDDVTNGIALGDGAYVKNKGGLAIGVDAMAGSNSAQTATNATAIGNQSKASSDYSVAVGYKSTASGKKSVAIGNSSIASGEDSTAIGYGSKIENYKVNATAVGSSSQVMGDNGTAVGKGSIVGHDSEYSTALGRGSYVYSGSGYSEALGANSIVKSKAEHAVALGSNSIASESNTVSVGVSVADADSEYAEMKRRIVNVADGVNDSDAATVGQISKITGMDSEKGNVVQYDGEDKAAVTFAGTEGTALKNVSDIELKGNSFVDAGLVAGTTTTKSTLLGNATAENNMILGDGAEIYVQGALGKAASVENSMAIGQGAEIHAQSQGSAKHITDSIAFGQDSYVSASNSVAIGAGSTATEEGVVSVGSANNQRRIVNVADGNIGENSIDAVNGSQLYAVREGAVSYGTKMEEDLWGNEKEVTDYSIVTLRGENGTKLTNLAAGEFKDGSKDAVTAGQLYAAGIVPGTISSDKYTTNGAIALGENALVSGERNGVDGSIAIGDEATVDNTTMAVALGSGSTVSATHSIALGANSTATASFSTAVGPASTASGDSSTAVGYDSTASGMNSAAFGYGSEASGMRSTALGHNSSASGMNSVALGYNSTADKANVVSVGNNKTQRKVINVADGTVAEGSHDAVTGGQLYNVQSSVTALDASAVQYDSVSKSTVTFDGTNGTALKNVSDIVMNTKDFYGKNAQFSFQDAGLLPGDVQSLVNKWNMAIGEGSAVNVEEGTGSKMQMNTVVGNKARITQALVDGEYQDVEKSTALGQGVTVAASNAVGVGQGSNVRGEGGVAVGMQANVSAKSGVAVGKQSKVSSDYSIAIGGSASVGSKSENSVAMGYDASSLAAGGTAIGQGAKVQGSAANGTAIGKGAIVNVNAGNSVALGASSQVQTADIGSDTEYGVVSVGKSGTNGFTRRIVNVADGVNDSDAATYGQVKDVQSSVTVLDNLAVKYDSTDKGIITLAGEKGTKLTNLADGEFKEDSTDAVTAGQLYAAGITPGDTRGNAGSVAMGGGYNNYVLGANGTAIGYNAGAGENAVAIGNSAAASHANATAVGQNSNAMETGATAFGQHAWAEVANSTAIGYHADVEYKGDNSVALGANSIVATEDILDTDTAGVVSVGSSGHAFNSTEFNRRIINVADGVNDSDAATYGQVKAVQSSVTALDNLAVKYDTADKTSVTFNRDNKAGSVLNNVNDIVMQVETYNPSGKVSGYKSLSFKEAGIIPGTVSGDDNTDSVVIGRDSKSSKKHSVVVGDGARTLGMNATAIGTGASAEMDSSVAIGSGSQVGTPSAVNGTAVGAGSKVTAKNGTAVGQGAFAWGTDSTVLGASARVERNADGSVALGKDSYAKASDILDSDTKGVVSVGKSGNNGFTRRIINVADGVNDSDAATVKQVKAVQGDVDELNKLAVTYTDNTKKAVNFNGATLKNVGDIQIGNAQSTFAGSGLINGKVYNTEAGTWAENGANATHSMAVGSKSSVRGKDSIAVGPEATVNNGNSVVLEQSTAVGSKATVLSNFSTALGAHTQAKGNYSVAVGAQSQTTGANATAIGAYAAAGENSVVVGGGEGLAAPIVKSNGTAMGTYVDINADNGTALGYGSQVGGNGKNSVALGADSVANEENVVSVGHTKGQANGFGGTYGEDLNRRITNVADGKNANDAATVGQISKITGMDSEKGNVVQYDNESKDRITFGGANGTELLNISNLSAKTATIGNVSFTDDGRITNVTAGVNDSDVATVGQIKNLTGLDSTQGNVVQYDKEGNLNVSVGDSGLKVDNTASSISHGDNSISVGDDGTTVTGDLNVTGDLTFNGETVSSDDLANAANVAGDVSDIKEQIGAGADGKLGLTNEQTTLVGGINANTEAINGVKTIVGDGKLDNGAADLTAGINANSAAIEQNRQAIGVLGSRVSDLGEEVDSVGAISAALAGLHPLDYNGTGSKFQISAALGTYDGTQAAAIGGFYHFNRDTLLSIGGSTSFEGDRKTAANVGVTFRVGEGASEAPAVQDNETKQQMEAMKQEIEMLKAELEQLKNKDTEGTNDKN